MNDRAGIIKRMPLTSLLTQVAHIINVEPLSSSRQFTNISVIRSPHLALSGSSPQHRNLLVSGKLTRLQDLIKLRIGLNYNVRILSGNFHLIKLSKICVGPAPPPPLNFFWICACVLLAVTFLIMSKSIFKREFI